MSVIAWEPTNAKVRLRLVTNDADGVSLCVVDEQGHVRMGGVICTIDRKHGLSIQPGFMGHGLPLSEGYRISTIKYQFAEEAKDGRQSLEGT